MSQNLQNTALTQVELIFSSCFQSCNTDLTKVYRRNLKKKKKRFYFITSSEKINLYPPRLFLPVKKNEVILMIQMIRRHFKNFITVLFLP